MTRDVDAIVIGAGFAGLRALHSLRAMGLRVVVLEAAAGIGGVWYFNQYPGARCDVESYDYSYRFAPQLEQDWRWSERYATQPEILRYINHVADRFDLRRDIEINTRMERAEYDEDDLRWTVTSADGRSWRAAKFILAVGQLSTPKRTEYPGQTKFSGRIIYSAQWPDESVDFAGKRVAIIGTGSSGVQMTPVIAELAVHLAVFQRTANFSIPAVNAPLTEDEDAQVKANYRDRREKARNSPSGLGFVPNAERAIDASEEDRRKTFEAAWNRLGFGFALTYKDILLDERSNELASEFIRGKIAERVHDPVLREKLTPRGFPFGTRRPSVDSGYFETFNRDNVSLVDLAETPIVEFTAKGIRTTAEELEFDIIIYATGFDAFTGSLLAPRIAGRGGVTLAEKWAAGPTTFLGIGVDGFPNMFIIVGPGSPSLLSNVLLSSEEQIDWLVALFEHARDHGIDEIEVTAEAERDWVEHVNERAKETLYLKTPSYYMGAEMPNKPRVFMPYSGGVRYYRRILEKTAASGYEGFDLRSRHASVG